MKGIDHKLIRRINANKKKESRNILSELYSRFGAFKYSIDSTVDETYKAPSKTRNKQVVPDLNTMIMDQTKFDMYLKLLVTNTIVEKSMDRYIWHGEGRQVISLLATFYVKMRELGALRKFNSDKQAGESLYKFFNIHGKTLRTFHETLRWPNTNCEEILSFIR